VCVLGGGAEQSEDFEKIKAYLANLPVLYAPKAGRVFRLYVAVQPQVIGKVLAQEEKGKEFTVAYLSQRLVGAETRYAPIEKLYLALYYACTKLRHYILTSTCVVVCQHDVVKYMLHKPILRGRLGKWAYTLVEYDLTYELLRSTK
jgi:hypothetical protein